MKESNQVHLIGNVSSPVFSHEVVIKKENRKVKMYKATLSCMRLSGAYDNVPIVIHESILPMFENKERVEIVGELRTNNTNKHLNIYVYALNVTDTCEPIDTNKIIVAAFACKVPVYRQTPQGKFITDLMLAINHENRRCSYIPAIVWGNNASKAKNIKVGEKVFITGRFQSRNYTKTLEDGTLDYRTAYEISVNNIDTEATERCD